MAKSAAPVVIESEKILVKNGLCTTEFWLSLAPIVVSFMEQLTQSPKDVPDAIVRVTVIVSIAVVAISYNLSRARTKAAASLAKAAVDNPDISKTVV